MKNVSSRLQKWGLYEGAKWGHMTCVRTSSVVEPIIYKNQYGDEYDSGNTREEVEIELKCDCGETVIFHNEFPGKRRVLDCGKCKRGANKRYPTAVTFTCPIDIKIEIENYASENRMAKSHAYVKILEAGMQTMEIGKEQ